MNNKNVLDFDVKYFYIKVNAAENSVTYIISTLENTVFVIKTNVE